MDAVTLGPSSDELRDHYAVDDLDGGLGQDRLRGGFAHGTIYASGGEGDTIACGKGKGDFAIVDPLDTTVLRENVRLQALPT